MNNKWYIIKNFDEFVDHARSLVFKFFGTANEEMDDPMGDLLSQFTPSELEEMNDTLSHNECSIIIKNKAKIVTDPKTKTKAFKINDNILYDILEEMNGRLVSNILAKLVQKDILDSAFDSDQNDFIFWIKDDNKHDKTKDTPETD
jgi:hypothetical protein